MAADRHWLLAAVHHPPRTGEAVSEFLFAEGADGLWEDQPDESGRAVLKGGFQPEAAARLRARLPEIVALLAEAFQLPEEDFEFRLSLEENRDWSEKWKEGLAPITIDDRLVIEPTWWSGGGGPPPGAVVLRLDPGLAFGTGRHATTFLCLKAMLDVFTETRPAAVLDVGAGSGILALAARAFLPRARVVGLDHDPDAVTTARDNAALNQLPNLEFSGLSLPELSGRFDLVVANLTLNPLLALAEDMARAAGPEAVLIVSGLLENQTEEIIAAYGGLGFELTRRLSREEWAALVFRRFRK